MLNSNKELFDQAVPVYQEAMRRSKHTHQLEYSSDPYRPSPSGINLVEPSSAQPAKRRRRRDIIHWNPPYSMNVKTNIGAKFLALIDRCFPKDGPLGKAFNRSNLKISYSTCPNMKQIISAHNRKVFRFRNHDKSFNNLDYKHETVLSTHIWECKARAS